MKTKLQRLIIAALFVISAGFVNAQEWEKYFSGYNYIYTALEFPENQSQIGYAAGGHVTWNGNGIVIKTTDGGDTWSSMWTGTNQGIEGMSFPSLDTGYVVGFSGYVGRTTDGGQTWTSLSLGVSTTVVNEIIFKDNNNGIAFPMGHPVRISNDAGNTWTVGGDPPVNVIAACHVSDNIYFAVGLSQIIKTDDGGLTWTTKYTQSPQILTGIRFFDENNGYATGEDGIYVKTTDGGETWTKYTIASGFPLWRDVAKVDDNTMYMVGTPEQIWKTTDGGTTWENDFSEGTYQQAIYELKLLPNGTLIAGASQGYIFRKQAEPTETDYPFTEDFEGSDGIPAGWTVYNQAGDATWNITTTNNHTPDGSKSAWHNYASGMQDGWLVTPQISMPTEGYFFLIFWDFNGDGEWYGKNSVLVSTGSPDPADNEYLEVWTVAQVTDQWVQVVIDLEDYAGEDIYIAFRYEGDYAHYWFIDDIALGVEINTDPIMVVTPEEIEQSVSQTGTSTNRITIHNEGIGSLAFDVAVEYIDEDGWLAIDPVSGSVAGNSSQMVNLTFNGMGLDLGSYSATITVTSNDAENPEATIPVTMNVMDVSPVNLVILQDAYTFPVAISENGQHVVGTPFGGQAGYYWSEATGVVNITAGVKGVSNTGVVVGTFPDPDLLYNGNPVEVAGRWTFEDSEFEFLGMHPSVPNFTMNSYNSAWGISSDGTVVGMQYYDGFLDYKAFSWTEEDGYDDIGYHPSLPQNNRPNGINADGTVVYGWSQSGTIIRSPVFWHGENVVFVDPDANGEANAASPNGLYVVGNVGVDGFITNTSTSTTTIFENQLNPGRLSPAAVTNDGYVFGFTAEGFPPLPPGRRAFVRYPNGNLTTFNDYAIERGWFDAADWTFYAISGVSGDGNRFIGAGIDKDGNNVSFMIDFAPAQPVIEVNPLSLSETLDMGETSEQTLEISNTGEGNLTYNAVIQYVVDDAKVQEAPVGRTKFADRGNLQLDKKEGTDGFHPASKANDKNDVILNYDGANVDAIGLNAGGTFYGAARYPSQMVAPFGGYELHSVDVYIGSIPTEIKLMIWDSGTTTTPGALLHEQVFTPTAASWNTVELDEVLKVSGADLWVGFMITHNAGVYVLGIDGSPANLDGNLLSQDPAQWEHLSDYGLNGNWNIRARLQYGGVQWLTINPASGNVEEDQSQIVTLSFDATDLEPGTYTANIRINNNSINEELVIIPVTLEVTGLPMYTLTLLVQPEESGTVSGAGTYIAGTTVTVNAVPNDGFIFVRWTDADENIVSEVAESEITISADITLIAIFQSTVSVPDIWEDQLKIFPNPASDFMFFMSGENIREIELFNAIGQIVYRAEVNHNNYQLNVSNLKQGFYLVRLKSVNGDIFTTRILIAR